MANQNIFYCLVFGFTLGIFVSSFFKMGFSFFLFLLLLSVLVFIFSWFQLKDKAKIMLIAIFILCFGLGILRYEIKDIRVENDYFLNLLGEKVKIEGLIIEEPNIKDQTVELVILSQSEKILVSAGLFPEFKYGDLIQAEGKLEKPENFSTDMGKDFDYVKFLAREDIFYQISFAQVRLLSSGNGSFIKTKLFAFKNAFINKINLLIKEPESSLLAGLLLGAKNSLGKERQNDFRVAGVSHIVALSGYNITIVADSIMVVLSFLPRVFSLSFGVSGIILFAIMTGGSATVIRASIMALLVLLAKMTHRKYDISRALLLAGVFMLIQNPKILVFDISFQLSFLATLALILVSPQIEKKMTFITEKYKLREIIVSTIATQIFVLPFIVYKMGMLSLFGFFTNILILPFIPTIMFLGAGAIGLGFISIYLAIPVAFIVSLLLSYCLQVIYLFAHLPWTSFSLESFPLVLVIIIYAIFLIVIWRAQNFSKISINEKYE